MSAACDFEGCTVGETRTCALERDPATCEHRRGTNASAAASSAVKAGNRSISNAASSVGAPVLDQPGGMSSFPSSRTLGPEGVSRMMAASYVTVVGILGDPESGKTACLVSLYLMVANARLDGWSFADSKSLMAFEDIARGAREWNTGHPPEQMTVHTEMSDDRRPGFLHLRLVRDSDGRRVDLVLPDLPGEWTTELVGTARADRFEFMNAAEAIWVVVDGLALANKERRQGVISRVGQLAGRLNTLFDGVVPRLMIVVTHRDAGQPAEGVSARLVAEVKRRKLAATIVSVAPFSESDDVRPGLGIVDLIDATVGAPRAASEFWPTRPPQADSRTYLSFRRDR
jgi:hypothetical protein